jgi:pimeloyl-ACP methyl ester carboxylesterase
LPAGTPATVGRRRFDVSVRGRRLVAEWLIPPGAADDPAGPPLVFLHEGLGSIAQWTRKGLDVPATIAAATGRRALVWERLGFGGSDPLPEPRRPDYLHEEAEVWMPAVLAAAGVGACLPVGHSDGASIALSFAAAFRDRAEAVVSEAAHVIVEPETLAGIRAARVAFQAPDGKLRAALERFHGAKTDATFAGWAELWLQPEFAAFDMTDRLPRIACPVLALQGDGDEYATARQLDLIAAGVAGPCRTWIVPDCRHVPHFQAADAVLPAIVDFVRTAGRT